MIKDCHFMQRALELAKISYENGDIPVGAVLVRGDEIIAEGYNQKELLQDASAHAEMIVLKKASEKLGTYHLEDTSLYVTLEPCAMCAGAIMSFRVNKVYIGARNERFGCCGSKINLLDFGFNHKCEVEFGIMENECSEILSSFFKELRNI